MLMHCLETCIPVDNQVKADVKRALSLCPPLTKPIDRDAIHDDTVQVAYDDDPIPPLPQLTDDELPYPGATL